MIIAIDGPAGSGKSTTARRVAARLGYLYLDTGAMYRAVALAFLREGCESTPEAAERLLPGLRVDVHDGDDGMHVLLGEEDVTHEIRTPEVTRMSSRVSALPAVREKLVHEQRRVAYARDDGGGGVVLEGRDIGTVVFPDADLKVFMVADATERARRRQAEMAAKGQDVPLEDVLADIEDRDRRDAERAHAPLRQADDALPLDTTDHSIETQVDQVVWWAREREEGIMH